MRPPRLRLSVRVMMFAVAALGCALGWIASVIRGAHAQQTAFQAIQSAPIGSPRWCGLPDRQIFYENDFFIDDHGHQHRHGSRYRAWLGGWLGRDYFLDVVCVWINGKISLPDPLGPIEAFPGLEYLALPGCGTTDPDMAHLSGLTRLRDLLISRASVTDAGLAHLAGLSQLRRLRLTRCPITDAGLAHLTPLKGLEELDIDHTQVTEAAVAKLQTTLPTLKIRYSR